MNEDDELGAWVLGVSHAEALAGDSDLLSGASALAEDTCARAEAQADWDGDPATMPTRRLMFSPSTVLPDLARIQEGQWPNVLSAVPERLRMDAVLCPGLDDDQIMRAQALIDRLPPAPSDEARAALRAAPAMADVPAARPGQRRSAQVNVRLSAADYEMVRVAGGLVGMKPTELARALVVSGARRMTFHLDRQIAAGPGLADS